MANQVAPFYSPKLFTSMPSASSVLAYAQGRVATVDQYVADMKTAVLDLVAPVINPEFPTGGVAPAIETPAAPDFVQPVWVAPAMPSAFTEVLDLSDLQVEPFDENPPELIYGAPPQAPNVELPDAPAVNLEFDDPTLSVNLPATPNLLSISVAPFGGLNMPTFDAVEPTLNLVEPSIREYVPGSQYTSELLTALQDKLQSDITSGSTGLGQQAETALWERGAEREYRSAADAITALEDMEATGFMLPPGAYVDARLKIITETDAAIKGHSREVMVESARLALQTVQNSLQQATALEGQLINYTNSVEQRIFEATRYATEAGVAIYNAKVAAYGQMVEVYKTKVDVYRARIQAELAKVEVYKAQIDAEQAKAQVNTALVAQYSAQVQAALSAVTIYQAQIAGIQAKADIEKTKVEVYGEQVRGYTAQINAYTAQVEGFRATLGAETAKQEAYRTRVQAFATQVDAVARQSDARIAAYRGRIEAKTAQFDAYRAAVQGESARVQGMAQTNGAIADAYRAEVSAVGAYNDVLTRQWQATLDQNQRTAEIGINTAKANAELYITTRSLALDASKTGATVASQVGAAAINALNYSASMSSSDSYGASTSYSFSQSSSSASSVSSSNSNNVNYNYSV